MRVPFCMLQPSLASARLRPFVLTPSGSILHSSRASQVPNPSLSQNGVHFSTIVFFFFKWMGIGSAKGCHFTACFFPSFFSHFLRGLVLVLPRAFAADTSCGHSDSESESESDVSGSPSTRRALILLSSYLEGKEERKVLEGRIKK